MTDPTQLEKAAMRRRQHEVRGKIAKSDHARASAAAAEHVLHHFSSGPARTISLFWPMGSEIDTRPLMARLDCSGWPVALPVMRGAGRSLLFRRWRSGDSLIAASFGVKEPAPSRELLLPEVFMVPLLAFDRKGYRLGYGGGFYDRTLREARAQGRQIVALGLAFAAQEVERVIADATDERLDGIVTEHGHIPVPAGP